MKKIFTLLSLIILMIPVVVKADVTPVSITSYAKQATIGSEIVVELKCTEKLDGKLKYNSEELEFVSITSQLPSYDLMPPERVEVKENKLGELVFTVEEKNTSVLAIFKVKKANSDSVKITYYPEDKSLLYGSESKDIEYSVIKETKEVTKEDKSKDNDICLYIPWAVAGFFTATTIYLATKLKRK